MHFTAYTLIIQIQLFYFSFFSFFFFQHIKSIAETGCNVVVTGGKVGELALHYCNKYNLLIVRVMSKFDLRRLARSVSATVLPKIVSIDLCLFDNSVNREITR